MKTGARTILISGAGIAGPTLAFWLLRRGFRPTVVELAPGPRSGGYVIDFWGLGYEIAERMGLEAELKERGYRPEEVRFVDDHGRRTGGFGVDAFRALTNDKYVTIARSDLAMMIYRKIADDCEMIFGDGIVTMTDSGDGIDVTFAHGGERRFDLVIGADGLHSAVRRLAFGADDRFEKYLGYGVAAFESDGYQPREDNVYISHGTPGRQISRFALRKGRTLFLFVFATDAPAQSWPRGDAERKQILTDEFRTTGWEAPRILAALAAAHDIYFDPVSQIRLDLWARGRTSLVGDAAFCPSLLAGQGSALAMAASYVLAGELAATGGQYQEAFARYDHRLRRFILGKQRTAEKYARAFVPRTEFGLWFRDSVSRLIGVPGLATLVLGRGLLDRLRLPDYPNALDQSS